MVIPAIRLITRAYAVKKEMIFLPDASTAIRNKGRLIPIPYTTKFRKLLTKPNVVVLSAKRTVSDAGLQGNAIKPKREPNKKAPRMGFFARGPVILGRGSCLSKIIAMLISPRSVNVTGPMIPMALLRAACKKTTTMRPKRNMDESTPATTHRLNCQIGCFLLWPERYARNPGYIGSTHTAPRGAKTPARKESQRLIMLSKSPVPA